MTTAQDIIDLALKDSGAFGVGQTVLAQDSTDALRRLNMMISQWSQRRWLVYHLVDTSVVCTDSKISYTVGTGGDFNIARPAQIEAAFIRQVVPSHPNQVDWPLSQIASYEDYSTIAVKTLKAAPSAYFFYDSGFPLGKVYPWPVPNSQYELHILTKAVLQSFASLGDTVVLPPEYEEAIYTNLMVRFRMAYRLPADPVIMGLAKAALATLRKSNFQIANLRMPGSLTGAGAGYNIYADRP